MKGIYIAQFYNIKKITKIKIPKKQLVRITLKKLELKERQKSGIRNNYTEISPEKSGFLNEICVNKQQK